MKFDILSRLFTQGKLQTSKLPRRPTWQMAAPQGRGQVAWLGQSGAVAPLRRRLVSIEPDLVLHRIPRAGARDARPCSHIAGAVAVGGPCGAKRLGPSVFQSSRGAPAAQISERESSEVGAFSSRRIGVNKNPVLFLKFLATLGEGSRPPLPRLQAAGVAAVGRAEVQHGCTPGAPSCVLHCAGGRRLGPDSDRTTIWLQLWLHGWHRWSSRIRLSDNTI